MGRRSIMVKQTQNPNPNYKPPRATGKPPREIICSFNEDGTLSAYMGGSVEIFFDDESERHRFEAFVRSGALTVAYKCWKGGAPINEEEESHE